MSTVALSADGYSPARDQTTSSSTGPMDDQRYAGSYLWLPCLALVWFSKCHHLLRTTIHHPLPHNPLAPAPHSDKPPSLPHISPQDSHLQLVRTIHITFPSTSLPPFFGSSCGATAADRPWEPGTFPAAVDSHEDEPCRGNRVPLVQHLRAVLYINRPHPAHGDGDGPWGDDGR